MARTMTNKSKRMLTETMSITELTSESTCFRILLLEIVLQQVVSVIDLFGTIVLPVNKESLHVY